MVRHLINRQPAKALPYFLRLRKPHVFDLIRDHNLFTAVQDQALLLVEFDQERSSDKSGTGDREDQAEGIGKGELEKSSQGKHGAAVQLLIDHIHSIPVSYDI